MKQVNILYISTTDNVHSFGAEQRLLDILQRLDKNRFRPVILLPRKGVFYQELEEIGLRAEVHDFRFRITQSNPIKFIKLMRYLWRLLKDKKIDLAHFNMHYYIANFWLPMALLRIPVIVHYRSYSWIDIAEKFLMARCHKLICVSHAVKQAFLQKRRSDIFIRFNEENVKVIYDGVDSQRASQSNNHILRKEFDIRDNEKIIALIGALDPIKGQDMAIEAFRLLLKLRSDVRLLIIGDVYFVKPLKLDYINRLKRLIEQHCLQDKVILTGYRDDVPEIIQDIDILIQPSSAEGLGTSMIESMSLGKPVIGTNVGGIPEVIGDNEAGILVQKRTPQAFADAICHLLNNPDEMQQKGLAGRERVLKYFDVHKNIKQIEDVYDEVLGIQRGGIHEG